MFDALTLSNATVLKKAGQLSIITSAPAIIGGIAAIAIGAALGRGEEEGEATTDENIIDGEVIIEHDSDEVQD